jgi:hypothetical protein
MNRIFFYEVKRLNQEKRWFNRSAPDRGTVPGFNPAPARPPANCQIAPPQPPANCQIAPTQPPINRQIASPQPQANCQILGGFHSGIALLCELAPRGSRDTVQKNHPKKGKGGILRSVGGGGLSPKIKNPIFDKKE